MMTKKGLPEKRTSHRPATETSDNTTAQKGNRKDTGMKSEKEQIHYEITLNADDSVKIEAEGCSITSEYIEDKHVQRTTMNPVKILFSALAL